MKLEIEYYQLVECINILNKLKLKGLDSIHRTRLAKQLSEILQRVGEEQTDLQKEFYEVDEKGEPILEDDKCKDKEGFDKAIKEFVREKAIIDSGDSQVALKSVKASLEQSEELWDSREAYAFEYLYSAFQDEEKQEEND